MAGATSTDDCMITFDSILRESKDTGLSVLVLGRSGTGKTRLIRTICEKAQRETILVNGNPSDYSGMKFFVSDEISEGLTKVKKATIILEDHFTLNQKEHSIFRKLINFTKRHYNTHICMASHSVAHTSLRSLLPYFDIIVFTKTKITDQNLAAFFASVKPEGITLDNFERVPTKGYGVWSNKDQRFFCIRSDYSVVNEFSNSKTTEERKERAIAEIIKILEIYPEYLPNSVCFLHYLMRNLGNVINFTDFTFRVTAVNSKNIAQKISLPDYILVCMRDEKPSEKMLQMKKYLASKFYTPDALVRNPYMKTDA